MSALRARFSPAPVIFFAGFDVVEAKLVFMPAT
jgi:hypothetical protein